MHACESTEPNQIETSSAERTDRGWVVADGDVTNGNVELLAELLGEKAIQPVQFLGVLIRDGANA